MVLLRYVTGEWVIKQKVCCLMLLAKSLTGEELAHKIIMVLSTELGIPSSQVIPRMHDRASINYVAMRTASILYNQIRDIGCVSHTLDLVEEHKLY